VSTTIDTKGWAPGGTVSAYLAVQQEARRSLGEAPRGSALTSGTADAGGRAVLTVTGPLALALYGTRADTVARWVLTGPDTPTKGGS
jgi:hypothetical protein